MDRETSKRKIDLLKSIMSDPKLSKTLSEALKSPIGSTKRDQARSVFSVLKKINKKRPDGQGGPYAPPTTPMSYNPPTSSMTYNPPTDYSNMIIFQPAPEFKKTMTSSPITQQQYNNLYKSPADLPKSVGTPITKTPTVVPVTPQQEYNNSFRTPEQPTSSTAGTSGINQQEYNDLFKTTPINQQSKTEKVVLPYEHGLPVRAWESWSEDVLPAVADTTGKVILGGLGSLAAAGEYAQRNVKTAGRNAWRDIVGYDPNTEPEDYKYTKLGDTWGVNQMAKMFTKNNLAKTVSENQEAKKDGSVSPTSTEAVVGALNNQPTVSDSTINKEGINEETPVVSGNGASPAAINSSGIGYNSGNGNVGTGNVGTGNVGAGNNSNIPSVQNYVNNSIGASAYALDFANSHYPDGFQAETDKNDEELKNKLGYTQYEDGLNNMEANKGAFISTLTSYVRGRDEYLSAIDQMIENTEMSLMDQDMSNPAVAESYNNYLKYLYTLKGRQTQRYGNYLNSAVDEYDAAFKRLDSKFDTVQEEFSRLSNRNYDIKVNEYNNLLAAGADAYKELQEAPMRAKEMQVIDNQLALQAIEIMDAVDAENNLTDDKYAEKSDRYEADITDGDGNINFDKFGPGGLAQYLTRVDMEGPAGNKYAFIEALQRAINSTMSNINEGDTSANATTLLKVKKLVDDLDKIEGGNIYTEDINPVFGKQGEIVQNFLTENISSVKDALNNLVSKDGPLAASLEEAPYSVKQWLRNYSSLGDDILNKLASVVTSSTKSGSSPKDVVKILLTGDDEQIASNLAAAIINVKN